MIKLLRLFCPYLFAAAMISAALPASGGDRPDIASLYQAQAIVTGTREETRAAGFRTCLEKVLPRVSGDPRVLQRPELAGLLARAGDFIADFRYRDRMEGMPIHDDQGTYDRPHDLYCTFDVDRIDKALAALGSRPWLSERPTLVVLLAVEQGEKRLMLSAERDRWPEMHESFSAAAEALHLDILFPDMAALAETGPDAWELGPAKLESITASTGGDVALVGHLSWSDAELGWIAEWRLHPSPAKAWGVRGVNFDQAFRVALRGSAQILSGNGQP